MPKLVSTPPPAARPPVDPRMLAVRYFEDLHVGMRETLMKTVMDTDIIGFARISGDDNPIHLCDVYAAGTRFGQRIAHGLYTASLISAVLGTRLPGPGAVYRSQTLHFQAPVAIGDVVIVTVEVVELIAKGRKARLATRPHGERWVEGCRCRAHQPGLLLTGTGRTGASATADRSLPSTNARG